MQVAEQLRSRSRRIVVVFVRIVVDVVVAVTFFDISIIFLRFLN